MTARGGFVLKQGLNRP